MNEEKTYSDIDIIADAVGSIGQMQIRVDQMDTIGAELNRIRNNLTEVLKAKQESVVAKDPEVVSEEVVN